jgi:hypothetical protein
LRQNRAANAVGDGDGRRRPRRYPDRPPQARPGPACR